MKRKILISFLIIVSNLINSQNYSPSFQSNQALSFTSFLQGVKFAYITVSEKDAQYIADNPNSGNSQAIAGLFSYLKAIGFEDVTWYEFK